MSNNGFENDRPLNPTPDSDAPEAPPAEGPPAEGPPAEGAPADAPAGYSGRHMVAVGAASGVVGAGAGVVVGRYTAASTGEELTKRMAAQSLKTFADFDGKRHKLSDLFDLKLIEAGHPVASALRKPLEGRFVETAWQRVRHPLTDSVKNIVSAGEAYAALTRAADEASAAHAAAQAALLAESGEDLTIAKERAALLATAKLVLGEERKAVLSRIQRMRPDVVVGTVAVIGSALDSTDMYRLLVEYEKAAALCHAAKTRVDLTQVLENLRQQGANATATAQGANATATAQATAAQSTAPPKS